MLGRRKKEEPRGRNPVGRLPAVGQNRTFSYHASRSLNEVNTGRVLSAVEERTNQRSKLHALMSHLPVFIASLVILLCIVDELSLNASPKIVILSSTASNLFLRDTTTYQATATKLLSSSWYNHNKLTVDTNGISSALEHSFPELLDVSVTLPILGHRPVIYIQPSEPALALTTNDGKTFLLDGNGKALMKLTAQQQLQGLHIVGVTDQSGLRVSIGQTVLPSTTVNFLQVVLSQLSAQHMSVKSVVLPPSSNEEIDVYLSNASYYGKFNLEQGDALQQVGTFIATSRYLSSQGKGVQQYIDVRIDGRAYYQ